jgi:hypothetical protein
MLLCLDDTASATDSLHDGLFLDTLSDKSMPLQPSPAHVWLVGLPSIGSGEDPMQCTVLIILHTAATLCVQPMLDMCERVAMVNCPL